MNISAKLAEFAREKWSLALLLAVAGLLCFRSAYSASNLETVPDGLEYAIGAHRLVFDHSYTIPVAGRPLPPRYPPWFSLALTPAYLLLGREVGNAIYPVFLFSLLAVGAAWMLGRRLGGVWGGVLAGLLVLAPFEFRLLSVYIWTDVPATALGLCAGAWWLKISEEAETRNRVRPWEWAVAGLIVGVIAAFRPLHAALILPFVFLLIQIWRRERRLDGVGAALLCAPLALLAVANLAYNQARFGHPLRSGYHFWCAVPCDFFALVFSPRYISWNLPYIAQWLGPMALAAGAAMLLLRKSGRNRPASETTWTDARRLAAFAALGAGPVVLLHLFYFSAGSRFYMPAGALLAALTGGLVGRWLGSWVSHRALRLLLALLLVYALVMRLISPPARPERRWAAEEIAGQTPANAIIVTAIEPPYLEFMLGSDSRRLIVPLTREVEYASKVLAPKKVGRLEPPPTGPFDHRAPALLAAGAEEAVPIVASENMETLASRARAGTPVYLSTVGLRRDIPQPVIGTLRNQFAIIQITPTLFQLQLR